MNDREIVELANELAAKFYGFLGKKRPDDFEFWRATHPEEKMMWDMAAEAMETLLGTDANDAVSNIEDE